MNPLLKKTLTYVLIVVAFLFLAYGFVPQVLEGKIVDQSDISGYVGMAHETNEWNNAHPSDRTAWTNSMFGGMPTTMLSGNTEGDWTKPLYNLTLIGKRPASYLFISLIGAFLLLLSFGIHPLLAAGGAVAITFCSYNMQIIQVGHNAKMLALAFTPGVLAAVVFTYRCAFGMYRNKGNTTPNPKEESWKEWLPWTLLGACLFAMALNFQIKANHVQITYYLAIIIACYVVVLFVWLLLKDKEKGKSRKDLLGRFLIASALLLVIGCIGIGTNSNRLLPTYKYTQETMRGGSELKGETDGGKSKGLDLEYATSWSYGWEELPNLMIPNFNGGSSAGSMNPEKSETAQLFKSAGQNYRQIAKSLPLYWGPQPFTAGPMYMGAITIFLFLLGLFLYRGKERWWILIPTVIAILLALGNHFMAFTKFFYNHVPFYNKFRTVSMALVVLQITLPLLGFIVLDKILKNGYTKKEFLSKSIPALILSAGVCLIFWVFPHLAGTFQGGADSQMQDVIVDALIKDRISLLRADALTSLILIAATFAILYWTFTIKEKDEAKANARRLYGGVAICLLILINMFAVGKRYLNSSHFVTQRQFDNQFTERPVDKMILEDKEQDYRVLDLTVNVFNDSHPSYFHKNIGGYSPVKLQRYQDLIEWYLSAEISSIQKAINNATDAQTIEDVEAILPPLPILSMLNDKYIILDGNLPALRNRSAMGSVWLVEGCVAAATPSEEIALIGGADLHREAVIGEDFSSFRDKVVPGDSLDRIELVKYTPNELRYSYSTSSGRTAVFSEIYYPNGWTAWTEDGNGNKIEDVDIFRCNWTLRGAVIPKGEGTLVMRFAPKSYTVSTAMSRASSITLILITLLSIAGVALPPLKKKKGQKTS